MMARPSFAGSSAISPCPCPHAAPLRPLHDNDDDELEVTRELEMVQKMVAAEEATLRSRTGGGEGSKMAAIPAWAQEDNDDDEDEAMREMEAAEAAAAPNNRVNGGLIHKATASVPSWAQEDNYDDEEAAMREMEEEEVVGKKNTPIHITKAPSTLGAAATAKSPQSDDFDFGDDEDLMKEILMEEERSKTAAEEILKDSPTAPPPAGDEFDEFDEFEDLDAMEAMALFEKGEQKAGEQKAGAPVSVAPRDDEDEDMEALAFAD